MKATLDDVVTALSLLLGLAPRRIVGSSLYAKVFFRGMRNGFAVSAAEEKVILVAPGGGWAEVSNDGPAAAAVAARICYTKMF